MFRFLLIAMLLLLAGCDYFDDSEDTSPVEPVDDTATVDTANDADCVFILPAPVNIPTDVDWELVATLQRNPLSPAQFYIFPEPKELMVEAYLTGKHFIFEIGGEFADWLGSRHYIIQPYIPFQDKDKHPGTVKEQQRSGIKIDSHFYAFLSEGWYVSVDFEGPYGATPGAVGLGVEFSVHRNLKDEILTYGVQIGLLNHDSRSMDFTHSYISDSTRLRVYVSR